MRVRVLAGIVLALFLMQSAQAAPIFEDPEINNQLQHFDVSGLRFGDTVEQVHNKMRVNGWTQYNVGRALPADSFTDAVRREVSKKTGKPFVHGQTIQTNEWFRKGAQTIELDYRAHSKGVLVTRVRYRHEGLDQPSAEGILLAEAERKFEQSPLLHASNNMFCLTLDSACLRGKSPSLPYVRIFDDTVTLFPGEAVDRSFGNDLENAIKKALGPQDIAL